MLSPAFPYMTGALCHIPWVVPDGELMTDSCMACSLPSTLSAYTWHLFMDGESGPGSGKELGALPGLVSASLPVVMAPTDPLEVGDQGWHSHTLPFCLSSMGVPYKWQGPSLLVFVFLPPKKTLVKLAPYS